MSNVPGAIPTLNERFGQRAKLRRPKHQERGAQLAELAIVLPVLLVLLAAIAEFGSYFYTYMTLSKATRSAARYLSAKVYTPTEVSKAKNMAVCGNADSCSGISPVLTGLTTSNIEITSAGGEYLPQTVKVRIIGYQYQPVFNLAQWIGGSAWANVDASPSTTMRYTLEN